MLQWALSFEPQVSPPEFGAAAYAYLNNGGARTGTWSLRIGNYTTEMGQYQIINLKTAVDEIFFQGAWQLSSIPSQPRALIAWYAPGGAILGGMRFNPTTVPATFDFYTGNFATLVGSCPINFAPSQIFVLELHIKIADAGGLIELHIDLIPSFSFNGDTKPGADATIGSLKLCCQYAGYSYWSDLILHDATGLKNNSWPNGAKVLYLPVTGDGATKQWTPSSGADHYALLDECPPDGVDNIQSANPGEVDELTFDPLPAEAQTILAVIPQVYGFKTTAGSPSRLALGLDLGGVQDYSPDLDLPVSSAPLKNVWEQKPGGGDFSPANVNSLKYLLKSAA
jgi:hypothetical protein